LFQSQFVGDAVESRQVAIGGANIIDVRLRNLDGAHFFLDQHPAQFEDTAPD